MEEVESVLQLTLYLEVVEEVLELETMEGLNQVIIDLLEVVIFQPVPRIKF